MSAAIAIEPWLELSFCREEDRRMSLEYDWKSNTYRSRLGDALTPVDGWRSFETLADARHQLRLVGLRLGAKIGPRTWRVEAMELA
jgi:hypothetical protein